MNLRNAFLPAPLAFGAAILLPGPSDPGPLASVGSGSQARPPAVVPGAGGDLAGPSLRLPFAFVENRGQWRTPARFVARSAAGAVHLATDSLAIVRHFRENGVGEFPARPGPAKPRDSRTAPADAPRAEALRFVWEGGSPTVRLEGEEEVGGRYHFFFGNDPRGWRTEVPAFSSVAYRGLYEGVDLRVRGGSDGPAYDLLLAPGADLGRVRFRCEGAEGLEILPDGSLEVRTASGQIRQSPPVAWTEESRGERKEVECRFRRIDPLRYGFEVEGRDPGVPLVVDPALRWSTFLGGVQDDAVFAVARTVTGSVFAAGETASGDFPATPGTLDTALAGLRDAFVCRFDPTLLGPPQFAWATYLGGSSDEGAYGLALDGAGGVILAGYTDTPDSGPVPFPTTPGAFDATQGGSLDAFLARLNGSGSALLFSTFLGGSNEDWISELAAAAGGTVAACGITASAGFPTTPSAFDTTFNGVQDAFLVRVDPAALGAGQLLWSTFLGGSAAEGIPGLFPPAEDARQPGVAVGPGGSVTVVGRTESTDFPTTTGPPPQGSGDGFVVRFDPAGIGSGQLLWSTLLGGNSQDYPWAVAVDLQGGTTVTGGTLSPNFPATPGAFDTTYASSPPPFIEDAFVTRFNASGTALVYSTYLGDLGGDFGFAVAVGVAGEATVLGVTAGATFPTTPGALDTTYGGGTGFWQSDVFLTRLHPQGNGLLYSTFLGGTENDFGFGLAQDPLGAVTIGGSSLSPDFPTTPGAFDPTPGGGSVFGDGFLAEVLPLPIGLLLLGYSTPGCSGPLAIGATSIPLVGNASFALTCSNAPPSSAGLLAIGDTALEPPFLLSGLAIWIDPLDVMILPAESDAMGSVFVPLPIPADDPANPGTLLHFQFFFPSPCGPLGWSASNALSVVVQH